MRWVLAKEKIFVVGSQSTIRDTFRSRYVMPKRFEEIGAETDINIALIPHEVVG